MKPQIVLIAHNLRSTHNVGSLLRTAEGLGITDVWLTGYTPYPNTSNDTRLPHITAKLTKQINKTALGAEEMLNIQQANDLAEAVNKLKSAGFTVVGLEQNSKSIPLTNFNPPDKVALILGNEAEGLDQTSLDACDQIIEIPMYGKKESFNVVQAAAIALGHWIFGANT